MHIGFIWFYIFICACIICVYIYIYIYIFIVWYWNCSELNMYTNPHVCKSLNCTKAVIQFVYAESKLYETTFGLQAINNWHVFLSPNHYLLVVEPTPLKHMSSSSGMMKFPTEWNKWKSYSGPPTILNGITLFEQSIAMIIWHVWCHDFSYPIEILGPKLVIMIHQFLP